MNEPKKRFRELVGGVVTEDRWEKGAVTWGNKGDGRWIQARKKTVTRKRGNREGGAAICQESLGGNR